MEGSVRCVDGNDLLGGCPSESAGGSFGRRNLPQDSSSSQTSTEAGDAWIDV